MVLKFLSKKKPQVKYLRPRYLKKMDAWLSLPHRMNNTPPPIV